MLLYRKISHKTSQMLSKCSIACYYYYYYYYFLFNYDTSIFSSFNCKILSITAITAETISRVMFDWLLVMVIQCDLCLSLIFWPVSNQIKDNSITEFWGKRGGNLWHLNFNFLNFVTVWHYCSKFSIGDIKNVKLFLVVVLQIQFFFAIILKLLLEKVKKTGWFSFSFFFLVLFSSPFIIHNNFNNNFMSF